jgi:hypothetical protein
MKIDTCLLCDAASVREGLLFVMGGGVSQTMRPDYPSSLDVSLAMRIFVHPTEANEPHKIVGILNDEDGHEVTKFEVQTAAIDTSGIPAGIEPEIMFAWDFPARPDIPHPGKYSFEILIDGNHQRSVPFTAVQTGDEQ